MFKPSLFRTAAIAATAIGLSLSAGAASANGFISLNPFTLNGVTDSQAFIPTFEAQTGFFANYYQFELAAPASQVSSTISFMPEGGITGFAATLYSDLCPAAQNQVCGLVLPSVPTAPPPVPIWFWTGPT